MLLAAVVVALVHVVPELERLLRGTGQRLPLQTRILVGLSEAVRDWGWAMLLGALGGAALGAHALARSEALRTRLHALQLRLPLVGGILRKLALARFAALFATLYGAGINVIDALHTSTGATANLALRAGLYEATSAIEQGRPISAAFEATQVFPPLVIRMLRLGEHTGALDDALAKVATLYRRDVAEGIARLQAAAEPALTILMGGLLLWIAERGTGADLRAHHPPAGLTMRREPLLLAVTPRGLLACIGHGNDLQLLATFLPGEEAGFASWLARRAPDEPCRVLVNLPDEAYEIEDLPRVRGGDRRALLARRLAHWFPEPRFARASALGVPPDGRKGFERVLFAGLERSAELLPWLERLEADGRRPELLAPAAALLPRLPLPGARQRGRGKAPSRPRLVAAAGCAGLRIALLGGRPHPVLTAGARHAETLADPQALAAELERTRDYLLAQHRIAPDALLDRVVVDLPPPTERSRPRCPRSASSPPTRSRPTSARAAVTLICCSPCAAHPRRSAGHSPPTRGAGPCCPRDACSPPWRSRPRRSSARPCGWNTGRRPRPKPSPRPSARRRRVPPRSQPKRRSWPRGRPNAPRAPPSTSSHLPPPPLQWSRPTPSRPRPPRWNPPPARLPTARHPPPSPGASTASCDAPTARSCSGSRAVGSPHARSACARRPATLPRCRRPDGALGCAVATRCPWNSRRWRSGLRSRIPNTSTPRPALARRRPTPTLRSPTQARRGPPSPLRSPPS